MRIIPLLRIISLGIVFAFLYFASSVVVTLLLAVLLAYFLDPVVELFERMHIPRSLGALAVLLAVMSLVGGLGFLVAARADQFVADWPRYSAILRQATTVVNRKLATVQKQVEAIGPEEEKEHPPVRIAQSRPVSELLFLGVGSLYSIFLSQPFYRFWCFSCLLPSRRFGK